MRIFKTKWFARWAEKESLSEQALIDAVAEMDQGLIDANLGSHVVKKRVAKADEAKVADCAPSWHLSLKIKRSSCMALPRISMKVSTSKS